jgi:hypothetical protein
MKLRPEVKEMLDRSAVKPAERRLLQILLENNDIRADVLKELEDDAAHKGAGLERVFDEVLAMARAGEELRFQALADRALEGERRLLYELAFETGPEAAGSLDEARACLRAMHRRKLESELRALQMEIKKAEQEKKAKELRELLGRKQALSKALAGLA